MKLSSHTLPLFDADSENELATNTTKATYVSNEPATLRSVEQFPAFNEIQHGDLLALTLSTKTTDLTHGMHRFPAKYIPHIPRWAIREFASYNSVVLDPFMGSGTTLVEALCAVKQSYGLDIDPLAKFITQAKIAKYDLSNLHSLAAQLIESEARFEVEPDLPMGDVKNPTHWFTLESWRELSSIFHTIEGLKCSGPERSFFYCVFSSILRWVSNADDQTQKTYVSGTLKKSPPPVVETFSKFLAKALSAVAALDKPREERQANVLEGDALSIPLPDRSVDLIVTSPPYLDSVDYMYNFMLEYFWLGPELGVQTRSEFNQRRRKSVGAKNPMERSPGLPLELTGYVDMDQVPEYRREAVISYFSLMLVHFREAARAMKNGARYVLVVGNSQADTGVLPVHDCLLRLARATGLHLEKAFAYRIRRHYMKFPRKGRGGIILMDWVIILKKTDAPVLDFEDRLPIPDVTIGGNEVAH